jgi:hypothetical protein
VDMAAERVADCAGGLLAVWAAGRSVVVWRGGDEIASQPTITTNANSKLSASPMAVQALWCD